MTCRRTAPAKKINFFLARSYTGMMLNLPNLITIARILVVPVFIWMLWQQRYGPALAIFLAASLSDGLDGYLARRLNQVSRLGAMLDSVADKIAILAALVVLTALERIPLWLAFAMIGRDLIILSGAALYRMLAGSLEITPTSLGKLHTFLAFLMVCVVLGNAASVVNASAWLPWLFDILLISAVVSAAHYMWVWGHKARRISRG